MKTFFARHVRGFISLLSVIIFGAVGVAIVTTLILLGTGSSQMGLISQQSMQAAGLADACAELALQQVKYSLLASGTTTLSFSTGSCSYGIANLGGQSRDVTAVGTVSSVTRGVAIILDQITPTIHIVSWQDVAP